MRRTIPSLQALACFDAAARHESYTRAAQELAMTQGAVSRQISGLEAYLGVALFRRTRHGVALTPQGVDYFHHIAPRLAGLEQDTQDAMSAQGGGGVLHVATVPTFATRWLIPRLPLLAQTQPDLTVHLETRTRAFLFADEPFDCAVFAGTQEQVARWAGTQASRLMAEDMVPVCAPWWLGQRSQGVAGPSAQDMASLPLLQQSTRPNAWRDWFDLRGVRAAGALAGPRFELFSMTLAAASAGLGLALVPRLAAQAELARGELVLACNDVPPPDPHPSAYYLVTPQGTAPRPVLRAFSAWLVAQIEVDAS